MKLKDITINNFRGIRSLRLPLDDLTALIGENNAGKSTVLEALRLVLTRGFGSRKDSRFSEYDFHLKDADANPLTADPIDIRLHFAEEKADEWPVEIPQQLSEVVQLDMSNGTNHIWLRAMGAYNQDTGSFDTSWSFLNTGGVELILKNKNAHTVLVKFMPPFFLSAIRDASQEFGQRGQFWKSFLKTLDLPVEQVKEIEEKLQEVNASVIAANTDLGEVISKIGETRKFVPLADAAPVVLEAIPTKVFDLTGRIQVYLKSQSGAKLPLYQHGEGTQSLAVLMLFQAFTALNLTEVYEKESTPLLALEEPEAHLHPSAIRSLGTLLKEIDGQRLVTSHSGDLISRVPITSLRRLYKQNGETKVGQVSADLLDERELQAVDYHIRLNKGHYLFSRCWFFVEGESDFYLIPLLFEIMGAPHEQVNVSVIEFSQSYKKGEPFVKVAKSLGIQWFLVADGDGEGNRYINRFKKYIEHSETISERAVTWSKLDIEHEFWHNGYSNFILNMLLPQTRKQIQGLTVSDDEKSKKMIAAAIEQAGGKPAFANALATEIRQRGVSAIPQSIKDVITRVVQLAGG